jgi:hypothetical protein
MLKIPFLKSIFIAKPAGPNPPPAGGYCVVNPMESLNSVELIANKGIIGDRFFDVSYFKLGEKNIQFPTCRNVSLINIENIDKINLENNLKLEEKDLRRNLILKNIKVELLLGRKFRIGGVEFLGVDLCKSCKHIEEVTNIKNLAKFLHPIGGLRAKVLCDGRISVGDKICLM